MSGTTINAASDATKRSRTPRLRPKAPRDNLPRMRWGLLTLVAAFGCQSGSNGTVADASSSPLDASQSDASEMATSDGNHPDVTISNGSTDASAENSDAGATPTDGGTACSDSSVTAAALGSPCVPEQEVTPSFAGFSETEVSIQSNDFQCANRICLINHFQGRTTCPYGQDQDGSGPDGLCLTPQTCEVVQPPDGFTVLPQCADRRASSTVYCSCRCANPQGTTDDDSGPYCVCPSGMICTQLVRSVGPANVGLAGAYCIKAGTEYDAGACTMCNPVTAPCP